MTKTPSRPKPTSASDETLVRHYNSQVDAYNAASEAAYAGKRRPAAFVPMQKLMPPEHAGNGLEAEWGVTRKDLVALIRRQNHRLKRHIKPRALELLYEKVRETLGTEGGLERTDAPLVLKDGKYTVGHTYQHILSILREEFPEASTSVACLRWYVVYERTRATDEGLPWPDLPHFRPRSSEGGRS